MKDTVEKIYERNRKRLLEQSRIDDIYTDCDVMGVILTMFPNIKVNHRLELNINEKSGRMKCHTSKRSL